MLSVANQATTNFLTCKLEQYKLGCDVIPSSELASSGELTARKTLALTTANQASSYANCQLAFTKLAPQTIQHSSHKRYPVLSSKHCCDADISVSSVF